MDWLEDIEDIPEEALKRPRKRKRGKDQLFSRQCIECRVWKPFSDFYPRKVIEYSTGKVKQDYQNSCKKCQAEYDRKRFKRQKGSCRHG